VAKIVAKDRRIVQRLFDQFRDLMKIGEKGLKLLRGVFPRHGSPPSV
jgi:hypothetical protein